MKLLTLARDLQRRKARERHRLFIAEGIRAVEELLRSPLRLRGALASTALEHTPRGSALRQAMAARGIEVATVSEHELASAADTESPQGILAVAEIPTRSLVDITVRESARLLVLDGIQDPGNAGTLVRTAAALGADATLALPGTVDLWNAKVVRSSMGALFHRPAVGCTWEELDGFLGSTAVELWGASAAGHPLTELAAPRRLALAVGNEGAGLSAETEKRVSRRVSIPLSADVESLNVAVAAGILLHHFRT